MVYLSSGVDAADRLTFGRAIMDGVGRALGFGSSAAPDVSASSGVTNLDPLIAWRSGLDLTSDGNRLIDPYVQDPTIHRIVQSYLNQMERVELELRDRDTKEPVTFDTSNSIHRRLLERIEMPNTSTTKRRFIGNITFQLLANRGQSSIYKDRPDTTGVPIALVVLPMGEMKSIPKRDAWWEVAKWQFTTSGDILGAGRTYEPEEIIHIRYAPDLGRQCSSFGLTEVLSLAAKTDHSAAVLNKAQLENGGIPAALLFNKNPQAKNEEIKEFLQRFKEAFSGPSKKGKVGAFKGDWDLKTFDVTNSEMEWLEGRRFNVEEKARGGGLPKLFLGDYQASDLSATGTQIVYRLWFDTVLIPIGSLITESLNLGLVWPIDPRLEVVFRWDKIEALRDDAAKKYELARALWEKGVPLIVISQMLDMGIPETLPDGRPIPGLDVGFIQGRPVEQVLQEAELERLIREGLSRGREAERGEVGREPEAPTARAASALEVFRAASSGEIAREAAHAILTGALGFSDDQATKALASPAAEILPVVEEKPPATAPLTPGAAGSHFEFTASQRSERVRMWTRANRRLEPIAIRAERGIASELRGQANRIDRLARKVLRKSYSAGLVIVADQRDDIASEILEGFDVDAFLEAIYRGIEEGWGLGIKTTAQELRDYGISISDAKAVRDHRPKVVIDARTPTLKDSAELIRTALQETILQGLDAREGISEIAARIQRVMGASVTRSRTIARTETATARDAARFELAGEQGIKRIRWVSAPDEYVRSPDNPKSKSKFRHDIDDEVIEYGETFSNGLRFPHDPEWDGDAGNIVNCRCVFEVMPDVQGSGGRVVPLRRVA